LLSKGQKAVANKAGDDVDSSRLESIFDWDGSALIICSGGKNLPGKRGGRKNCNEGHFRENTPLADWGTKAIHRMYLGTAQVTLENKFERSLTTIHEQKLFWKVPEADFLMSWGVARSSSVAGPKPGHSVIETFLALCANELA
jgi:hypothetical protein